jgi:glycosyltransferase involved in cell wall biosynthesis
MNPLARKINVECGVPFIYTVHIIPQLFYDFYQIKDLITRVFVLDWLKIAVKNANIVIVPSKYVYDVLLSKYHIKSVIIPNGVNRNYFLKKPDLKMKEKLNLKNKKIILFVGQIRHSKGIHILIKAFKKVRKTIPESILLIVGGIQNSQAYKYFNQLLKSIKKNNIQDSVKFLGHISDKALKSLYSIANVFVLPSLKYEYQGIVLLEAMASKVPIIASEVEGIPYMVKDKENGLLFEKNNIKELSDKIIQLLENKKLKEELIEKSIKLIEMKYNWEKIAKKTYKIYKSVI